MTEFAALLKSLADAEGGRRGASVTLAERMLLPDEHLSPQRQTTRIAFSNISDQIRYIYLCSFISFISFTADLVCR